MSLKYKLDQASFDALDETTKAMYQKNGEGYQLNIDGMPEPQDTSGMRAKIDELLNESKTAKQKARDAEELAKSEAAQRATAANDFESLYKSSETEREKATRELAEMRQSIASEKKDNAAMKIANELADGTNAELLAEFVGRRIRYEDGKVQVLDANGNPTVSTVDDLKKEFASGGRYDSLLRGNKASGGGATTNNGGAVTKKFTELSGAELSKLRVENPSEYQRLRDEHHSR